MAGHILRHESIIKLYLMAPWRTGSPKRDKLRLQYTMQVKYDVHRKSYRKVKNLVQDRIK